MRKLLIIANIILGAVFLWGFSKNIAAHTGKADKNQLKLLPLPKAAKGESSKRSSGEAKLDGIDESAKKIIAHDVFNNVRSPLANVRTSRTQLTLVGIFKCGKSEGAIIRQNNSNRQFNPYLAQMMAHSGMMGNRGGMMGNRGGMMGGGMMGNRSGMMGGGMMGNRGGRFTQWSQVSGRSTGAEKQYVKLGETLSNGYTLAEITRTGVTLIRGNDRIELELQEPSRNRNNRGGSSNNRRPGMNSTQQFQQAQMIMQGQMMRTMQQMQRTIQSNQGGGGNRGGARR